MRALADALEEVLLWATSELHWRRTNPCAWAEVLAARAKAYSDRGWPRATARALRRLRRAESLCKQKRLQDQKDRVRKLGR
jgi:hypothetical protein